MKKIIWFTVLTVLGIVFVAPAILSAALPMIPAGVQPGYNPNMRLSIYSDRVFVQKFTSKINNLTAIGLSIRNPNLKNQSDVIFNIYNLDGTLLRGITISGRNLEDGSFIKLVFPPIADSLNKEYLFSLSTPGAGAEETIEVFLTSMPGESGIIDYSYDGETHSGGTPIVLYGKPESKLATITSVYTSWLSKLLLHR
jgi:hypothetical protein